MKHYLTFNSEKSCKLWQIESTGKSFTLTNYKNHLPGASLIKPFLNKSLIETS
jgi:hypothetical protein